MSKLSRIVLLVGSLMLALTYYLPLWQISLAAPQYPEGLGIEIWINNIQGQNKGDLAKINNLNHYIGMQKINPDSIPELKVMPWIMRTMMILGIITAILGKRRFFMLWLILFLAVSIAGLIDFYLWTYDYGHNLDMENAIIKIPGMNFQPPIIGSKQLLNFTATSYPGLGGLAAIAVFISSLFMYVHDIRARRWRKLWK